MILNKFLGAALASLSLAEYAMADFTCPPDGPLLPRPKSLGNHDEFKQAGKEFTDLLNSAVAGKIESGWANENVSFSIALVSLSDPTSASTWEYHHKAARNVKGTKKVDGDSQYLIGSISKVFTDLLLLQSGLNLDDPITKYLPELISPNSPIRWEAISLRALGSHLAGMQGFYGYPEMSFTFPYFEALGFPKLGKDDFPSCGIIGMSSACTRQQLLAGIRDTAPVTAPNLRPAYSSISFTLLSYAMEVATGKNYTQFLDEKVATPLKLKNTGASPGDDKKAVIPPLEDNSWGSDYGDNVPGGGLFSTTNDLSRFIKSILKHEILPEAAINNWLKPLSSTSQYNTLVGMPWEIYRSDKLTPNHPHTIDFYTKRGSALGYEAYIGIVDQYGFGFSVLTAGGGAEAVNHISDALLSVFVPAIEEATRAEAAAYLGEYSIPEGPETFMNVTMDNDPGLILSNLSSNGSDMLEAISVLWESQPVSLGVLSKTLRIYPADVSRPVKMTVICDGKNQTKTLIEEEWRLQYDIVSTSGPISQLPSAYVVAGACGAWQLPGMLVYGGEAIDRVVFVKENGKVVGVKVPSMRLNLTEHQ